MSCLSLKMYKTIQNKIHLKANAGQCGRSCQAGRRTGNKGLGYSNKGQEKQGQCQEKQQCTFISILCLDSMTRSFDLDKTFVDKT